MSLSPEQFAEHLAGLEAHTGLQYHPGGMTLPSGIRVPAMHYKAYPNNFRELAPDEPQRLKIRSVLPSETGALHSVIATQHDIDDNPGDFMLEHYSVPSMFDASEGDYRSGRITRATHRSRHPHLSDAENPATLAGWGEHVERSLVETQPPSDEARAHAADRMQLLAERTQMGKIMPVHGQDFDFDLRSR